MPFQLSPGVLVVEKDLTNVIPAAATSIGGFVGNFAWGPVLQPVTVPSEVELVKQFGKPYTDNAASFFSAANFLSYSNNLVLVRVVGSTAKNAVSTGTAVLIKNETDWEANYGTEAGAGSSIGTFAAKYPGTLGNSLKISMADKETFETWTYKDQFDAAPGTSTYVSSVSGADDEVHILVIDEDGQITGVPNTILEKYSGLSKAQDAKTESGAVNYYKTVLKNSKYVWWVDHPTTLEATGAAWGASAAGSAFKCLSAAYTVSLAGGVLESSVTEAELEAGYDLFKNSEEVDVNLIFMGPHPLTLAKTVIEDVAEVRRDCMVFCSPTLASVFNNRTFEADDIIAERTDAAFNVNTSYAVMDSGWKYQYDKYADVYRWVPLNADVAGLCARTDTVAEPWFSPGGLNRGQIRNVVKLAYSPSQTDRDKLYKNGINPVVTFPGEGTILFGDKTLLAKPSAFDRINVRRLFIVLEKAIATASRYQLFEFNDEFTRTQFLNIVEPFLRNVQGRRGITDFKVVCDDTNNTGEVIDRNEFIADIFIKPARSINFITLNFVAARSGVSFEEIAGA